MDDSSCSGGRKGVCLSSFCPAHCLFVCLSSHWDMWYCLSDEGQMDHHPDWKNVYNTVDVSLLTHASKGVTELGMSYVPMHLSLFWSSLQIFNSLKKWTELRNAAHSICCLLFAVFCCHIRILPQKSRSTQSVASTRAAIRRDICRCGFDDPREWRPD
jgi:hypothetical protein